MITSQKNRNQRNKETRTPGTSSTTRCPEPPGFPQPPARKHLPKATCVCSPIGQCHYQTHPVYHPSRFAQMRECEVGWLKRERSGGKKPGQGRRGRFKQLHYQMMACISLPTGETVVTGNLTVAVLLTEQLHQKYIF